MKRPISNKTAHYQVAILDAGAQYGYDIEQNIKRLGYSATRLPFNTPAKQLEPYDAVVLSGGPQSVYSEKAPAHDPLLFSLDKPLLGICYGMQLINQSMGGEVARLKTREDGFTTVKVQTKSPVFKRLKSTQEVLMSHGDSIVKLAPGFTTIAKSGDIIAGLASTNRPIVGLQFHPEVSTTEGPAMLDNFLKHVAGIRPTTTYDIKDYEKTAIAEIRSTVGKRQVLAFISGGVDSSTLAKLLQAALPARQLHLIYVDTGFMRFDESKQVQAMLGEAGIKVTIYDGTQQFLSARTRIKGKLTRKLTEVIDPEIKRKIIGDTFIQIRADMAAKLGLDKANYMLAQGTLYTDLIESGSQVVSGHADTIKSHHNDTAEVRRLRTAGRVIEPLRDLQKDEVRLLAKYLGLPAAIAKRQPFPGPGLAIRIICADEPFVPPGHQAINKELALYGGDRLRANLLPIRTVGVQGDQRSYSQLVGLSGVASWSRCITLARQIPRHIHGVNRVVYVFGDNVDKSGISVTPTHLTPEVINQLRQADKLTNDILQKHGLDRTISQVPVVLFPVSFDGPGKRSLAIRTLITTNYKSGDIAVPGKDIPEAVLDELVDTLQKLPGISRVVYDLTSKPPATTEWE